MFRKAERKQAKLRLALVGPAGSGKTFSALRIATGLVQTQNGNEPGRIAMIDTERGSGELYSDRFEYDIARLDPPFEPKRYIDLIRAAEGAGYAVLIIDSLSHAWAGSGGLLDIKDRTGLFNGKFFTPDEETGPTLAAWLQ